MLLSMFCSFVVLYYEYLCSGASGVDGVLPEALYVLGHEVAPVLCGEGAGALSLFVNVSE